MKVLSLDDDFEILKLLAEIATSAGFEVESTTVAARFLEIAARNEASVLTVDLQVPDMDGIEVLRKLAALGLRIPVIVISGMDVRTIGSAEYYAATLGLDVIGALQKPFEPAQLIGLLERVRGRGAPPSASDLYDAIESGSLMVHYQPVARRTEVGWDIDSVEAFVRWNHPERGLLQAGEFLRAVADESVSRNITDFVIDSVLEQKRGWRIASFEPSVRINISAALLSDVEFPDRLHRSLAIADVGAREVVIEVCETSAFEQRLESIDILTRLRIKNIGLAIDDFGIGYSSLTQLFRMPFTEMKIDGTLIREADRSSEGRVAVDALIGLAHKLNLAVCAEGVETRSMLDFLWDSGCDAVQGYIISAPRPAAEIPRFAALWKQSSESRRAPPPLRRQESMSGAS